MLGLKKGVVELLPHDERWHRLFDEEKARLQEAIGENIISIEHVGSTSICGISAKPVLDIAVAIEKCADGEKCVEPLKDLGYEYRGENGISGRYYFVKGKPRTHHLHMLLVDSAALQNHLLFRDYLRRNPVAAKEYDKLKKELSEKYQNDRDAYLDGKAEFVERILKIARAQ
jgi:GrpB-like predicted nucleotidyltransferase (UPF0157 family)